jgi:hypothetical protein
MEEPSVLDYLKSKLVFWKRPAKEIQDLEAGWKNGGQGATNGTDQVVIYDSPEPDGGEKQYAPLQEASPRAKAVFPWLPLIGLSFALLGQLLLEPPDRSENWSIIFYILAAGVILFAYLKGQIIPENPPLNGPHQPDPLTVRWEGLVVGTALMVMAFFTFGANQGEHHNFNFINTSLWLISIGYLIWAVAAPGTKMNPGPAFNRAVRFVSGREWQFKFNRYAVILLAVIGIVLFFRWYQLAQVPSDMVSDHAEKLLDVQDVLRGEFHTFFPRNTGREFFQFYWSALMVQLFNVPVNFMALKVGMVIGGLIALFYIYRLGFELGNKWVALLALLFCGISYWANIQARIALRFTLYPMFAAPLLYYMIRGLRTMNRNDFIKAGLWLGLGLHGYTSFRIVPLVVVAAFVIYLLHEKSVELRRRALMGLGIVTLISFAVFIPLLRFAVDDWHMFNYRSLTRVGTEERPLPGEPLEIFGKNTANALLMFQYDNGDVWVHSITHRPALDVASAALFFLGVVVVIARYVAQRRWTDLFLIISIPLFLLPSILSLAFPNENPVLNRTAAAYIPTFLILALFLDGIFRGFRRLAPGTAGVALAWAVGLSLFAFAAWQNYDILFNQYDRSFRLHAWNASEMGAEIRAFEKLTGSTNSAYVVAYPHWVDTRIVGIEAGHPDRDLAISRNLLGITVNNPDAKLFLLRPEDVESLDILQDLYPNGRHWVYSSRTTGKDFVKFMVLSNPDLVPENEGPQ